MDALNLLLQCKTGPEIAFEHGRMFRAKVTSDMAGAIYEANDGLQRRLRREHVNRYRRDMLEGRFYPVNPIIVTDAGSVIDGQHRINALAATPEGMSLDFPVFVVVANGEIEKKIRASTDIGASRSQRDVALISGFKLPTNMLAAWAVEKGSGIRPKELTKSELPMLVSSDPLASALAPVFEKTKKGRAAVFAAMIRCARKNEKEAVEFFSAVLSGDPRARVRGEFSLPANLLIRFVAETRASGAAVQREMFCKAISAWNAHRTGREIAQLRYTGTVPEAAG